MSIESISSLRIQEAANAQGAAQLSDTPNKTSIQRNETAADGEILPPAPAGKVEDASQVESAVSQISEFVQNLQRDLQFSVDEDSGRIVIKVIDSETNEVIRQIPPEDALRLARDLGSAGSLILKERA
ncbi:MAG TPA: flagellar protein FlaG [Gammaproteobacteria bacterium]|nr:flagellar protein FlaG [Gammaproteobacteria bacterium]